MHRCNSTPLNISPSTLYAPSTAAASGGGGAAEALRLCVCICGRRDERTGERFPATHWRPGWLEEAVKRVSLVIYCLPSLSLRLLSLRLRFGAREPTSQRAWERDRRTNSRKEPKRFTSLTRSHAHFKCTGARVARARDFYRRENPSGSSWLVSTCFGYPKRARLRFKDFQTVNTDPRKRCVNLREPSESTSLPWPIALAGSGTRTRISIPSWTILQDQPTSRVAERLLPKMNFATLHEETTLRSLKLFWDEHTVCQIFIQLLFN